MAPSQHPSEWDATIMKNNNVRSFSSVNRHLSCIIEGCFFNRIGKCQI